MTSLAPILTPQIDLRSAQDRSKSPLEALFFKNVNFHEISAGVVSGAFPGPPRRPKIDPRRLQDDLQDLLFSTSFLSSILVRLEFDFGSISAPYWPPFGSQNRPKCRASADPVELKTILTTHGGSRRPQEAPKTPQEPPKSRPRPSKTFKRPPKTPQNDQKSIQHTPKTTNNKIIIS